MVARAQIAALRHYRVGANLNLAQAVQHHIVAYPGVVANAHLPRVGDGDAGANDCALAHARTKTPQQPAPEAVGKLRRAMKQRGLHQPPHLHGDGRSAAEMGGKSKLDQVLKIFTHLYLYFCIQSIAIKIIPLT